MDKYQKLAQQLQDTEIKVLKHLSDKKTLSIAAIASSLNLAEVAVGRAAMYLENKKLIKQSRTTKKIVELDTLGKEYIKSSLPEFRFLKEVSGGAKSLSEIDLEDDEKKFCIGYLKRKGLISFDKGKVVATLAGQKAKESLESKFLKKLPIEFSKLRDEDLYAYEELSRRKAIIKTVDRVTVTAEITELGRKVANQRFGDLAGKLTHQMLVKGTWKNRKFRRYDVEAPVPRIFSGKKHAYLAFLDEVKRELVSLGFEEMTGPIVEATFFNSDALFMPQNHPARGIHDIYLVKGKADLKKYASALSSVKKMHERGGFGSKGWGGRFSEDVTRQLVLRTQTTALSARMLLNKNINIPGKYFAIGRCYRPDTVDSTHLTEFNQMEGIVVGEDVNFRQLLSLLSNLAKKLAGVDKIKFVPGYFPFTEPSVEGFVQLKNGRWVEIFAAGMFRPEVTKPLGIDVPVLAWGPGIDRLFMVKEGLNDIRHLFSQDLKWLRGTKL